MTRVFFRCPEDSHPVGGIKKLYDHVDVLNKNNIEAYILHFDETGTFRCTWFPNQTKITYDKTQIQEHDIVVFPEIYNHHVFDLVPKCKKVIFNQNTYNTFKPYGTINENTIFNYDNPDVVGVIVVSEDNKRYLESFLKNKIHRVHISIDFDKFFPITEKKKQCCYMPRKNKQDVDQVISILKLRGNLKDYNFVAIENMTEEELIKTYQESEIFLSFSQSEGCAAPPIEAIACGCIVVGYHGMGCREYLRRENYCYPVEHEDIIGFVKTTERVVKLLKEYPQTMQSEVKKAHSFITSKYTKEREEADILEFWNEVLSK